MRGTSCADLAVETFPTVEALPADARALAENAGSLFGTLIWWQVVQAHAIAPGAEAVFVTFRSEHRIVALVPMLRAGKKLSSLTTPYTCLYSPLVAADLGQPMRAAVMASFARFCRSSGVVRLDALPMEWDGLAGLQAGSRRAGLIPLRFDHFGNWSEDVSGLTWPDYLMRRPGALRQTILRRVRQAEKRPDGCFDLFTRPDEIDRAASAFESVYERSWKEPEPYPAFNVALMRATAERGLLRMGVWSIGAQPVATQMWVVKEGQAIVLKLAHDEAFKAHSPGTVLTALMIRHLLDHEHVVRIDFGRGDDAYKRGWVGQRRQRVGLLLANPLHPAGMAAMLRHAAGRIRTALRAGAQNDGLMSG